MGATRTQPPTHPPARPPTPAPSPVAGDAELGKLRDYAVDMVPKFIMAGGTLVKVRSAPSLPPRESLERPLSRHLARPARRS